MAKVKLYDKDTTTFIGDLNDAIECKVTEERNGQFELSLLYPNQKQFSDRLIEGNIIQCNAGDDLLNQQFRIYKTRKLMNNKIDVMARHISFDLIYDFVESISIVNQPCNYVLNEIFRRSNFSQHYQGFSDIVNAQDYNMELSNCLEAIGGKQGSVLDTFGTGAEILRDNTDIHVLNRRGHDNGVHITYSKNMTDITVEEDRTEMITRIFAYAKSKDTNGDEILIYAPGKYVDSPNINLYEHPYIRSIDFSDKFTDDNPPTPSRIQYFAEKYFRDNNPDIPKINYKISFIPLSKTTQGGPNDIIKLCDTVYVDDTRYNIQTQAKAIKTTYNVLLKRYDSIELGQPKTTLADLVGSGGGEQGPAGPPGPQGPPGADGNIGDFPDSLPNVPQLTLTLLGLESIQCDWTFEDKVYYTYQLYASKVKDFTPNAFDLIHEGKTSSFLFAAKPDETWYFRVRAGNTHNKWTEFSSQMSISTVKIDASTFIKEATIGNALIGNISADKINAGKLFGQYIDARNLSVTDGNGKRTLDIDSFGNINLMPSTLKVLIDDTEQDVATVSQLVNTANGLQFQINQTGNANYATNTDFKKGFTGWDKFNPNYMSTVAGGWNVPVGSGAYIVGQGDKSVYMKQSVKVPPKAEKYYTSAYLNCTDFLNIGGQPEESLWHFYVILRYTDGTGETKKVPCFSEGHPQGVWKRESLEFIRDPNKTVDSIDVYLYVRYVQGNFYMSMVKVEIDQLGAWIPGVHELNTEIVEIDDNGLWVRHTDGSAMNANSKSIDFTNENHRKKMSVKNGGLNYYNYQSGLFVGLDSSTQFSDEFSKFGMQKFASKHCSFYDILYSPTTDLDDDLKIANSVFRICFENVEGPTDYRSVKGIHSLDLHRFHEGIDMVEKPINSCGTIYMGTISTRNKVTYDNNYDEMQIGGGGGGIILGKTNQDGSVEHAIKIYEDYYIDTTRDWNFQGHKIENANIITNFTPMPMFRSFMYMGDDSYTNLIDEVDVINTNNGELGLSKKEYTGGSEQFNQTQLLLAAVEKIKELESAITILTEEINNLKQV